MAWNSGGTVEDIVQQVMMIGLIKKWYIYNRIAIYLVNHSLIFDYLYWGPFLWKNMTNSYPLNEVISKNVLVCYGKTPHRKPLKLYTVYGPKNVFGNENAWLKTNAMHSSGGWWPQGTVSDGTTYGLSKVKKPLSIAMKWTCNTFERFSDN